MIKNYFKIAWRSVVKQKLYSTINIVGLAIGLSVCILITLYVAHEKSFDKFHKNANRIIVLHEKLHLGDKEISFSKSSFVAGPEIKQTVPGIDNYDRIYTPYKEVYINAASLSSGNIPEKNMIFADKDFFSFFSFKLISGSANSVLNDPFDLVITQKAVAKYFGSQDPIGKTLKIKNDLDSTHLYHITGIAANCPSNSSIQFDFISPNSSLKAMPEFNSTFNTSFVEDGEFRTYLLLSKNADSTHLSQVLSSLPQKDKTIGNESLLFTPLTDMHLKMNNGDSSNIKYLSIFPLVAVLILLLALVNYMSLSTARATLRAKEIGVRKVAGASRKNMAFQFYTESALYAIIAFVIAYCLSFFCKDWLCNKLELNIDNSFFYSRELITILTGLLVTTILFAGTYPAIVLSSFKPVAVLKGRFSKQTRGSNVRKVFTILQFTIATGLIICGIIIDRQLYFIRHTDTGLTRENVVMLPVTVNIGNKYQSFRKDISSIASVSQVATAHYAMYNGYDIFSAKSSANGPEISISCLSVDENFMSTLGIQWRQKPSSINTLFYNDKKQVNNVVLNQAAVNKLNLPANTIGSIITSRVDRISVGGVIKNFNFSSLQNPVEPLGIYVRPESMAGWGGAGGYLFVKIKVHTNLPELLGTMQSVFKKYDQQNPFSYTFMDDAFNLQYKAEDKLASIFSIFTAITIILAALGLFGLTAFTIDQRSKEIGIRKILGAGIASIGTMLSKIF